MISVQCPDCFMAYQVGPQYLRKRIKCKQCGAAILVEPDGRGDIPYEDAPTPARKNANGELPSLPARPRRRKVEKTPEPEPKATKQRPSEPWLSAETTVGWKIAACYAGFGVFLALLIFIAIPHPEDAFPGDGPRPSMPVLKGMMLTSAVLQSLMAWGLWVRSTAARVCWLGMRVLMFLFVLLIVSMAANLATIGGGQGTKLGVLVGIFLIVHVPIVEWMGCFGLTRQRAKGWVVLLSLGAIVYSFLICAAVIVPVYWAASLASGDAEFPIE